MGQPRNSERLTIALQDVSVSLADAHSHVSVSHGSILTSALRIVKHRPVVLSSKLGYSSRRNCAAILIAVLVIALSGCGASKPALTADEESTIAKINVAFAMNALNGSQYPEVLSGTDRLIALCRAKRDASYQLGHRTVKQVVEDDANAIRQYKPDVAAQLDRVLNDNCA